MSRRFSLVAVVIAVAAIAAAGCGSSKSSSKAANPPPSTPVTPSTPSTGTSSVPTGNVMPGKLSSSTPIDSPVLKAALVKKLASVSAIPAKDDGPIADCVVKKLQGAGIKTYGEANKHLTDVRNAAATCTRQVLTGG